MWSEERPRQFPAPLQEIIEQPFFKSPERLDFAGQSWLVARSLRAQPPFFLASRAPGDEMKNMLGVMMELLDALSEEQVASQQLSKELLGAWSRLSLICGLPLNINSREDLPGIVRALGQALHETMPSEGVWISLKTDQQFKVYHAKNKPIAGLEKLLDGLGEAHDRTVILHRHQLPAEFAEENPGLENLILVPFPLLNQVEACLGLENHRTGELTFGDRQLLGSIAERVSAAINVTLGQEAQERNEALANTLAVAAQVRSSLIPDDLPEIPGFDLAAILRPAHVVGGDFVDVQPAQDGYCLMIGDVAGQGIPSAMVSTMFHIAFKSLAPQFSQPAALLRAINHLVFDELNRADMYVTVFLAVFNPNQKKMTYASAAHPTALLWCDEKKDVHQLPSTGLPIGVSRNLELPQRMLSFSPGDVLYLYSDGVTEAEDENGKAFSLQALIDLVLAVHPADAHSQAETIQKALDLHCPPTALKDDAGLLLIRGTDLAQADRPFKTIPFVFSTRNENSTPFISLVREASESYLDFSSPEQSASFLDKLELAASEVFAGIKDLETSSSPNRIQGRISITPNLVAVDLIDAGALFEGMRGPKTVPVDHLPAGKPHLELAQSMLDVCRYERLKSNRNHWRLEKRL